MYPNKNDIFLYLQYYTGERKMLKPEKIITYMTIIAVALIILLACLPTESNAATGSVTATAS